VEVFSIGFGGHTAAQFFAKLASVGIQQLVDVRLNNVSQLAGFTKRSDLPFFLSTIADVGYEHALGLAPTPEMLLAYRRKQIDWPEYERRFLGLLTERNIEESFGADTFAKRTVLLCSEPTARRCHRRLVLEYLKGTSIPQLTAIHL